VMVEKINTSGERFSMSNNNEQAGSKELTKTSFLNLLSEISNYGFVLATAIATMSISIFMDLINSTCNLLRASICSFLSFKLQKNQKYKYNYGTENLETISMLLCDALLILGTLAVTCFAVYKLFVPHAPGEELLTAVILKAINTSIDFYLVYLNYKTFKKSKTKVAKTNLHANVACTAFDAAVFLSVLSAFIFRGYQFVVYVEPIFSIIIAIYIISVSAVNIKNYIKELSYSTLEEEDQMKITKVLAHHFDQFEQFFSVNSHKSGKYVCIDFLLSFQNETTFGEIVSVLNTITKELESEFENCRVSIILDSQNY